MKSIQNHIYSIQKTFETLGKGKLLLFFLPGLIVGAIFFYLMGMGSSLENLGDSVSEIPLLGGLLEWFIDGVSAMINWILLFILQFILLTLLSPFNSALSEKFETELTGKEFKSSFVQFLNDMLRAIFVAVLAIVLELVFILVVWIISWFIPGEFIENILYFLIAAFFFGFAFYDYSLERHGVTTISSLGFAFSHMGHILLTGTIFLIIFAIPYIGMILAPVLATFIATGVYVKLKMPPATTETAINS